MNSNQRGTPAFWRAMDSTGFPLVAWRETYGSYSKLFYTTKHSDSAENLMFRRPRPKLEAYLRQKAAV